VVQSEVTSESSREEEPPAARFDDVARLSNAALATVFSDIDTEVAVLALTAADSKFVQRVLKQLSRREAKSLAKQLAQPVPMRLREVERAQQEVANIAQKLELSGQIQWNKGSERLAAVA
jgi:flagellar motor switch protein FliG